MTSLVIENAPILGIQVPKPSVLDQVSASCLKGAIESQSINGFSGVFADFVKPAMEKAFCPPQHAYADAFLHAIGYMRSIQPLVPFEGLDFSRPGFVPSFFREVTQSKREAFPGAIELHLRLARDYQGNTVAYLAEKPGESGTLSRGCQEILLPMLPKQQVKSAKEVEMVIVKQHRESLKLKGAANTYAGLPAREAKARAKAVAACFNYVGCKGVNIYIPADVKEALVLFLTYGGKNKTGYQTQANFVAVPTNWAQPVSGIRYESIRDAFRYIQLTTVEKLPKAAAVAGSAPISYVDTEYGFDIWLAGGSSFKVFAPVGEAEALVYFQGSGKASYLRLRPMLVGTRNGDKEYLASEIQKLSVLDVFWYVWESFGFSAMNRAYKNVSTVVEEGSMGATELARFVQKCIPTENEEILPGDKRDQRQIYEDSVFTTCQLSMPLPISIGNTLATVSGQHMGDVYQYKVNAFYSRLKNRSSLQTNERSKALAMVRTANTEFGLAVMPMGSVTDFVGHNICVTRYNQLEPSLAKANLLKAFACNWAAWGHYEAYGSLEGLSPQAELKLIIQALFAKEEFAILFAAHEITEEKANSTHVERFWELLTQNITIQHSNKESKGIKRCTSTYGTVCDTKQDITVGWVDWQHEESQENKAMAVSAALAHNMPALDPGMGECKKDLVQAMYARSKEIARIAVPAKSNPHFELSDTYQDVVTPLLTAESGLIGWRFPEKTLVKAGDTIGYVMVNDFALQVITAYEQGYLTKINWDISLEMAKDFYFTVYGTIQCEVRNSLKLREGLKLNALAVNMHSSIGYRPNGRTSLNGNEFSSKVGLFIPQDCYKGTDNFVFKLRIIGLNYAFYASTNVEMRELLVETNNAVYACVGKKPVENAKNLVIYDVAVLAGAYAKIEADFEQRFSRPIWHYQQTPNSALSEIVQSQSRNRAVATTMVKADSSLSLSGEKWRLVGAKEASAIYGENNTPLPKGLLAAVSALESQGTYFAPKAPTEQAFIATNAKGVITEEDNLVCLWMSEYDGRPHYQVLQRGFGWARKNGMDFLYPLQVEYTTIPQTVSSTTIMPFAFLDNALRGNRVLAELQASYTKNNLALDRLLSKFVNWTPNSQVFIGETLVPVIDLTKNGSPEDYFSAEQIEIFSTPELYQNKFEFMHKLSRIAGDVIFTIADGVDRVAAFHLGTLLNWGGASLKHSKHSALSALCDWFRHWIVRGTLPSAPECRVAAGSYLRMLQTYLGGVGHEKGLLRGEATVYMKAGASCIVPNDEVWVHWQDQGKFCQTYGIAKSEAHEITHVGFRRMPMFRTNVAKIRFLSKEDCNKLQSLYGVWFSAGRVYMGAGQMYSNFGDLDGDAIELDNLSDAVRDGLIKVDNFNSIKALLKEILDVDTFSPDYWTLNAVGQYVADHFFIGSMAKSRKKAEISWKKNVTTVDKFAVFQKAAGTVQTVTVGLTYKTATINAMLAEILPQVQDELTGMGDADWTGAYEWALIQDKARVSVAKLLQLYEVALGGYSKDMAKVTLGYLARAMNSDTDTSHWSLLEEIKAGIDVKVESDFSGIISNRPELATFNHIPTKEVTLALEEMGFDRTDLALFKHCFLMAGLSIRLPGMQPEDLAQVPQSLQLVLSIVQTVLDITQNKLFGESGESKAFELYCGLYQEMVAVTEESPEYVHNLVALDLAIRTKTVTGQMFDNYLENYKLKQEDILVVTELSQTASAK